MKHIAMQSWIGRHDDGQFIMPVKMYRAYCGVTVKGAEIDNENPTCDACMDGKCWEEIDAMSGRTGE
jgi:hypothetical protein